MKKWIIISITILLAAGLVFWLLRLRNSSQTTNIQTARATVGTLAKKVQSSGKTKAKRSVIMRFQSAGTLQWLGFAEGESVGKGQAVAKLDPREVEKTLTDALADYTKQRNDFEEMWRVTYKGTPNPNVALNDTAKRILQKNQWDLDKAVLDVELKALSVEYATLRSPISGIITKLFTPVAGINVTAATDIIEIADPDSLIFEANIDEVDIGDLLVGQSAYVSLDAFPAASFSGTIVSLAYASQLSSGGATVFPVTIAFDQKENLRVGLNGDVAIITHTRDNVLTVPVEAIREEDKGKQYVFTKTGKTYAKTPVETGLSNEQSVEILSGLTTNDEVVIKGFSSINGK
ncbi:efflux RND transporter periplasmic adaptor subunit [Candidatus Gottesmanbacteria bacterium]|nr:efflux RND transporter periplasmic adaptor subunit [Candidatus Gottesmanbacteria bacterium]